MKPATPSRLPFWLGLFFGLALLVNFAFLYVGQQAPPPLVRKDYYKAGLEYGKAILDGRTRAGSGITMAVNRGNPPGFLFWEGNKSLSDVTGTVFWYRPNDPDADFAVSLSATSMVMTSGRWDATVEIWLPEAVRLRFEQKLYLP